MKMVTIGLNILRPIIQRPITHYRHIVRTLSTLPYVNRDSLAVTNSHLRDVECSDSELQLRFDGQNDKVSVPLVWLRDSCECNICRDSLTGIRHPLVHPFSSQLSHDKRKFQPLRCSADADYVRVTWSDGHESTHRVNWILEKTQGPQTESGPKTLWDGAIASSLPIAHLQFADIMSKEAALKECLNSISKYGFSLVYGVPATSAATREIMERIGPIWGTFWGEVYHVVADLSQFAHPSYTGADLPLHTDTNYYIEGAGLQAFHVLEHDGKGGRNMLVDGFNVANNLKVSRPEVYEYLSRKPVSFKYKEGAKRHYMNEDFLLKHHAVTNELLQLRFTECDFDVFRTVSPKDCDIFYESLTALRQEINDPKNAFWLQLIPGIVMVTDNWRVLHGRSSFTGKRDLCGMYVSRSDYLSKARLLGII